MCSITLHPLLRCFCCGYREEPTTPLLPEPKPSIASKKGPVKYASFESDTADKPDRIDKGSEPVIAYF